jgi:sorbitol-specific phosphotransferase system component IIA
MKVKGIFNFTGLAAVMAAALVLASRGGSGSSSSSTATPVFMAGTVQKDSGVAVNGVRFDASAASISADNAARSPDFLDNGMTVKLRGRLNDDGLTGVADRIKVLLEVRGEITSLGADSFTVLGQTILVNGQTLFADVSGLAVLKVHDRVEIHGLRDSAGAVMATRIQLLGADAPAIDEVRGIVANMTATTFDIGGLTIAFDSTTRIEPAGAVFGSGDIVEVHLSGTAAVLIEVERFEDVAFFPAEGQEFEVEGFISGFTDAAADFLVNDEPVRLADKITFKDTIRIEANADTGGEAGVLGRNVAFSSATRLVDLRSDTDAIIKGDGLKIRGFLSKDGTTISATRVKRLDRPVEPDKILLQGPVSSVDATTGAEKLVIAGVTVAISGVQEHGMRHGEREVALGDFLGSIVLDRTIVKARGSFGDGLLSANKLEIEDE